MMPISLYEVVQKAWTTIISKRIHLVWHNHEVLHSGQYGLRLDNGTLMALLNVIEGAIYTKETKHHILGH
jgi:ribonucleotide monophosphatase NagD (HAD superfamily)